MNLPDFHPFWPFLIAAVLALVTRGPLRAVILLAAPVLGLVHLLDVEAGAGYSMSIMDLELQPYRVDRLSLMFDESQNYVFVPKW